MAAVKGRQGQALGTIEDMQALARRHNERCLSSWSGPLNHRTQSPT
jgi:ATP/maltotriose-dependent transcriptional regulator MalT